jgi:hypothetical protein
MTAKRRSELTSYEAAAAMSSWDNSALWGESITYRTIVRIEPRELGETYSLVCLSLIGFAVEPTHDRVYVTSIERGWGDMWDGVCYLNIDILYRGN